MYRQGKRNVTPLLILLEHIKYLKCKQHAKRKFLYKQIVIFSNSGISTNYCQSQMLLYILIYLLLRRAVEITISSYVIEYDYSVTWLLIKRTVLKKDELSAVLQLSIY